MTAQKSLVTSARASNPRAKQLFPLNRILMRLSRRCDFVRLRDWMRSFQILGSVGSGKTSGVFVMLMRAAWVWWANHCGLFLCAKPDAADMAVKLLKELGKEYVIIRPGSGHRLNLITYAMENAGVAIPMDNAFTNCGRCWTF
jgi:hypothetical protein